MSSRSREQILEEADEIAADVRELDPVITKDGALAIVWEQLPELYDEYVAAPNEAVQTIAKSYREATLADKIMLAVKKKATALAWEEWGPNKSLGDLELDVWNSEEGKVLYDAYRGEQGRLPYRDANHQLAKSDGMRDVMSILEEWLA